VSSLQSCEAAAGSEKAEPAVPAQTAAASRNMTMPLATGQ